MPPSRLACSSVASLVSDVIPVSSVRVDADADADPDPDADTDVGVDITSVMVEILPYSHAFFSSVSCLALMYE